MKYNFKKNIAQKGGLMIEALAMLGLIAVVTPTMYKKSAERTLEVEDINTADTVRSYMGATEAYMAANYRNLIKEMTENEDGTPKENPETIKTVVWSDIQSYMPYGFQNSNSLYDYSEPKIAIVRQGSNLSAFALFPAKVDGGLGQERTSRIASLIGANGGYIKPDTKSAHGIGGVWNLEANGDSDNPGVSEIFGSGNKNAFSLVTVSSNVINSASGAGEVENTKYLQRTKENEDELWRNTMRTDLYMGGGNSESDPDLVGEDSGSTKKYSILNINSLIVGAEKNLEHLNLETDPVDNGKYPSINNGLYINPDGDNPNAYIGGTLVAAKEALFADENRLAYGDSVLSNVPVDPNNLVNPDNPDSEENQKYSRAYRFEVSKQGDVTSYGNIFMGDMANGNIARKINGTTVTSHIISGQLTDNGASLSLMSPNMFEMTTDGEVVEGEDTTDAGIDNGVDNVSGTHVMIEKTGFKGADGEVGVDSLGNDIDLKYTKEQTFPVAVGSNMMVNGVMAAGQVDAQHLRTATLSSGAENIDDEYKWMTVDKDGVVIQDRESQTQTIPHEEEGVDDEVITSRKDGTYVNVNRDGVVMRTDNSANGASIILDKHEVQAGQNSHTYGDITLSADNSESEIMIENNTIGMRIKDTDMKIGNPTGGNDVLTYNQSIAADNNPYRIIIGQGGNVDMVGSNLKIMDKSNKNVLTIKGNDLRENIRDANNNPYYDGNTYDDFSNFPSEPANSDDYIDYGITAHGNVLFSSKSGTTASAISSYESDDTAHFLAIGPDDEKAGVNIVEGSVDVNSTAKASNNERVLFVDLSKKNDNAYVGKVTSGEGQASWELTDAGASNESIVDVDAGKMEPGTLYVRKGLLEIVPSTDKLPKEVDNVMQYSTAGANEGSGIIRASRFVANNINQSGNIEKVPSIVKDEWLKKYNGENVVRYDTYMVNPAYTSVMKDIKLTTRGGARLSDILPDFITKGIYIANNTYDDGLLKMNFILQSNKFELDAKKMGVDDKFIDDTTKGLKESPTNSGCARMENGSCVSYYIEKNWASPFSGLVPAPQCPPGYARVITINPFRYEMGQAGQLALSADAGYDDPDANGGGYYVNTAEMSGKLQRNSYSNADKESLQNELKKVIPEVRKLEVSMPNGGTIDVANVSGLSADGKNVSTSGVASIGANDISGVEVRAKYLTHKTEDGSHEGDNDPESTGYGYDQETNYSSYVLSLGSKDGLRPLVFQQSTWFHSEAIPVVSASHAPNGINFDTEGSIKGDTQYVRGWAILQGFLYHYNEYKNFACDSNKDCKEFSPNNDEILWNLFPVAKNSIGSYVQTYCYFDRTNVTAPYGASSSDNQYHPYWNDKESDNVTDINSFEKYYDVFSDVPVGYVKGVTGSDNAAAERDAERKAYYEQLNDPTMKYNEVW